MLKIYFCAKLMDEAQWQHLVFYLNFGLLTLSDLKLTQVN